MNEDQRLYRHRSPVDRVQNVNALYKTQMSDGARLADRFAAIMGSWGFILAQSTLLLLWIVCNTVALLAHWDPYPFILLNLALSFQAAFATPIILMSQNRQAAKDRLAAEQDYRINLKSEQEVRGLIEHLGEQDAELLRQTALLEHLNMRLSKMEEQLLTSSHIALNLFERQEAKKPARRKAAAPEREERAND
jgi:uncharacterized membrane protein